MSPAWQRLCVCGLALSLVRMDLAEAGTDDPEIRAFVNDTCIVADEPYLLPPVDTQDSTDQPTARFFPLLGFVVGKLAEVLINHIVSASSGHIKADAARKDTRYAMSTEMNLYRADFQPEPTVRLNARLGCMTIVAARFQPASVNCTAAYVPRQLTRETMKLPESAWKSSRTDDSIENPLRRANICVDGKARAVYEARFEFSEDGTAYRLRSAGYRIDSLLTTTDKAASRTAFYTLEISQPGKSEQREALSTAWVHLGGVSAGARASGAAGDPPPWLSVPGLSTEARRAYEEKTKVHQQVMGEIDALKRALTRNQRVLAGLDQRMAAASADVAAGLRQERTRVAVQIQAQQAELEASTAEYQELPQTPLEFMPVTIEVAVTESQSEKAALLALAGVIDSNRGQLASAGATASAGLFSRSLQVTDPPATARSTTEIERARARYFDALVEARTGSAGASSEDAERNLALAKTNYNDARRALGLELIE
jgi:predicted outer membrane protein